MGKSNTDIFINNFFIIDLAYYIIINMIYKV